MGPPDGGSCTSALGLRAPDRPPRRTNEPLASASLVLSLGTVRPAVKVEGFPIMLLCAVINGNINFA